MKFETAHRRYREASETLRTATDDPATDRDGQAFLDLINDHTDALDAVLLAKADRAADIRVKLLIAADEQIWDGWDSAEAITAQLAQDAAALLPGDMGAKDAREIGAALQAMPEAKREGALWALDQLTRPLDVRDVERALRGTGDMSKSMAVALAGALKRLTIVAVLPGR